MSNYLHSLYWKLYILFYFPYLNQEFNIFSKYIYSKIVAKDESEVYWNLHFSILSLFLCYFIYVKLSSKLFWWKICEGNCSVLFLISHPKWIFLKDFNFQRFTWINLNLFNFSFIIHYSKVNHAKPSQFSKQQQRFHET